MGDTARVLSEAGTSVGAVSKDAPASVRKLIRGEISQALEQQNVVN